MTGATARRTRSYSQLTDYLHCGWSFYLKRIRRFDESPSVWLPAGTAFHSVTEQFDLDCWTPAVGDDVHMFLPSQEMPHYRNLAVELFERGVSEQAERHPDISTWRTAGRKTKDKPNGEDVDWWHSYLPDLVEAYINWRISASDTWVMAAVEGAPGVEVEIRTQFGDVPTVSFIDRVLRSVKTGELVVVDLKSGSRMPVSPMQLAKYSVELEQKVGEPVRWGAFYDARKGQLGELIDLSRFTTQKFEYLFDRLDHAVESGVYLPVLDSHCVKCGVREFCVWQGGQEPPREGEQ